jgi:dipeptidyl aminopeptidase/acylaminoacyl peptidase
MFVKLQRTGVPTELLLYPGGSHHLQSTGRPSHRLHALRRIFEWLERWIAEPLSRGTASER